MSAFTKISRDDVANSAESFGMGEFQDSRFFRGNLDAEQLAMAWHRIKPGQRSPIAHKHRSQEEIYVVIGGSGNFKLDDELVPVASGDVVRIPAATGRGVEAGSDGLDFLAFGAPVVDGDERDQGEMLEDLWD